MEIKLAESIVEACGQNGVKAELKEDFAVSWKKGRKTAGVVILSGDLVQVVAAVIANAHLFINGDQPKFALKNDLFVSTYRVNLILY